MIENVSEDIEFGMMCLHGSKDISIGINDVWEIMLNIHDKIKNNICDTVYFYLEQERFGAASNTNE